MRRYLFFIKNKFNKNQLLLILGSLIIFILFYPLFINLYREIIVIPILSKFLRDELTDVVVLIVLVLSVMFVYRKIKLNYQVSGNFLILTTLTSLVYLFNRWDSEWYFFTTLMNDQIFYADLLLSIPILTSILFVTNFVKLKTSKEDEGGFVPDESLGRSGKDLYGREKFAESLAEKIRATDSESSLAIGIDAPWGYGKTSIFDLIKRNLKSGEIIVDYSPWYATNVDNIIPSFFTTIENATKKYSLRLSRELNKYAKYLTNVTDNIFTKFLTNSIDVFDNKGDDEIFKKIEELIKETNRKIVIFIDDLDRLQKDEIIQVVRLIRNAANFSNTVFIVAYDRAYIKKAFEDLSQDSINSFLEKIFQIELPLPFIDKLQLRIQLVSLLKQKLPKRYHQRIDVLSHPMTSQHYPYLDDFIANNRDVIRFVNIFTYSFPLIENEILFEDYFSLTLIRFKYPAAIKLLYENRLKYLSKETPKDRERYFLANDDADEKVTKFLKDLRERKEKLEIPIDQVETIEKAINFLFGHPEMSEDENGDEFEVSLQFYGDRRNSSIAYPNSFYRYFANVLFSIDISDIEWDKILESDYDEFIDKLKELINRGLRAEVYDRLSLIKKYKDVIQFEKNIKAMFKLSNFKIESDDSPYDAHFNQIILIRKIRDTKTIVKDYYNGNSNKYKSFLNSNLSSDEIPFIYCVSFIYFIINDLNHHDKLILSKDELLSINIEYLRKYLASVDEADGNAWSLFRDCKSIILTKEMQSFHRISDIAKEVMKQFFKQKGLRYFLEKVAIDKGSMGYGFSDGVIEVFNHHDKILEFVNSFNGPKLLPEFKAFFEKSKEKGFQEYIDFNFKEIKIK